MEPTTAPSVTVADLLERRPDAALPIELLSGRDGVGRAISSPHIQKTGLALAGFHEYLHPARILVFGESEVRYLESLSAPERMRMISAVFEQAQDHFARVFTRGAAFVAT